MDYKRSAAPALGRGIKVLPLVVDSRNLSTGPFSIYADPELMQEASCH
jgi:hypothetical protein